MDYGYWITVNSTAYILFLESMTRMVIAFLLNGGKINDNKNDEQH
jgi:hypothetical protein